MANCDFCDDTKQIDGEPCGWCVDVAYTSPVSPNWYGVQSDMRSEPPTEV